jgi:hypothetical protein
LYRNVSETRTNIDNYYFIRDTLKPGTILLLKVRFHYAKNKHVDR